jgi:hypothetical protein
MNQKMKGIIRFVLWAFLSGATYSNLHGQISVAPFPAVIPNEFALEDIFRVVIVNTSGAPLEGRIKAVVETADKQLVLELFSGVVRFNPGEVIKGREINWQRTPNYGKGAAARNLRLSGQLPFGSYAICYQLIQVQGVPPVGFNCFEKEIRPFGNFGLISPADKEEIKHPNPFFSWEPIRAFSNLGSVSYSLKLAELGEGQKAEFAIPSNPPFFHVHDLSSTVLSYPPSALTLNEGKSYAWQVTARRGEVELGKTSVWTFVYMPEKKVLPPPKEYSYTYASASPTGQFAIAEEGILHLAYYNHYGLEYLNFEINSGEAFSKAKPKQPLVPLHPGLNQIDLPLKEVAQGREGGFFTLVIKEPGGENYFLRFQYNK